MSGAGHEGDAVTGELREREMSLMRIPRFALMVAIGWSVVGFVDTTETSVRAGGAAAQLATLGTMTARLNGQARTWYVVGDPADARQSSASWHQPKPGERMITIAGFDTETPPFGSFTRDTAGRVTSYGDYAGSLLVIVLSDVGANPQPRAVKLDRGLTLMYVAQASLLDPKRNDPARMTCAIHTAESGTLDVTAIGFDGDRAFVEGTVSATLATCDGRLSIADGRFRLRNLPKLDIGSR